MPVNKVVVNNETLLDLTGDTVIPGAMLSGYMAHDKTGTAITGTMKTATIYRGTSEPGTSVGANGDVYLVFGG